MNLRARLDEDILSRCRTASHLIEIGKYEAAQEALEGFWRGIGKQPNLENLPLQISAEVLLQCGTLSGWLGTTQQLDVQEAAKDLISQAEHAFQSRKNNFKVSDAQYELGMCYWRCGAFSEARLILGKALENLEDTELQAKILIRKTLIEISTGRYHEAWNILDSIKPSFESLSDVLKGKWHGQMALVLRRIANAEHRPEYIDRAIIEFVAAIYHYEQAGHERYCATNLNNLAMLLYPLERYEEAHEHLDRATKKLESIKDVGLIAQVNETRARVFLAEKYYPETLQVIAGVVGILEKGGEQALLSDALRIQATAMSQINPESSLETFKRAAKVAREAGALTSAGLANLSMIENHWKQLSEESIFKAYDNADRFLSNTQDLAAIMQLRKCARIVIRKLFGQEFDEYFNLPDVVHAYEGRFIRLALAKEKNVITHAAKRLGISHQRLSFILRTRHKHILNRPPMRKSIIKKKV